MDKSSLKGINTVLPFDSNYVKVGKGKNWNLMDSTGKLISDTWFTNIFKNNDGSITTEMKHGRGKAKPISVKFISVASLVKTIKVIDVVPAHCIDYLDSGSIEPYNGTRGSNCVAKAKLYGRTVFVDKAGDIYDESGTKLRLLLNTVDSERLYKAVDDLNHRLRYDYKPLEDNGNGNSSYEDIYENHVSMWAFYWVTENWCVKTDFDKLMVGDNVKKWTDDLIVRVFSNLPGDALKKLKAQFGEGDFKKKDDKYENISWHFKKQDLDKIIAALNAI